MKRIIVIFLIIIQITPLLLAQEKFNSIEVVDTFRVNLANSYKLKSLSILPYSEKITLGDKVLSRDFYSIDYIHGRFHLSDSLFYSLLDTVVIEYQTVLMGLKREYKRRSLVIKFDDKFQDSIRVIKDESGALTTDEIFGKDIQRSGSIIRGFTVGTNKDFSVNSGLRLQMSGKLSDDIEIVAALTDENTPIQPEGNTERLEELDKVFIQFRHPNVIGTFGDYELVGSTGEFGKINRKLQGLKGEFNYDNYGGVVSFASARGKFNSVQFNGDDGNQGPYRLTGINNERDIIAIAGSERIYVDGEELKRGENNDYVIEYANAEITFTPNRLITSVSRITVDFEYTDRQFQRNFVGTNFNGKFLNDKFIVGVNFFSEADDENSPIDITLSDDEKEILKQAGDRRNLAVRDGVVLAQLDSLGRRIGAYSKIDTVINGQSLVYYNYKPGNINSIYNVTFSYLGNGEGDYIKESIGKYKFVGLKQGQYLPVRYIPIAESKQVGNIIVSGEIVPGLNLSLELAGSLWDKNNFSSIDDNDNSGYARNLKLSFRKNDFNLGFAKLNKIGVSFRDRFVASRFTSLDRFNSVEFNRDYNITQSQQSDETLREASIIINPIEQISLSSSYGSLKKGKLFSSERFWTDISISEYENINAGYKIDYVESVSGNLSSSWNKQNGFLKYSLGIFTPGLDYLFENKKDYFQRADSLLTGSLRYTEIAPTLNIANIFGLTLSTRYSFRSEFSPVNGEFTKESDTRTQLYSLSYGKIKEVKSEMSIVFRNKNYSENSEKLGLLDNETVLLRSQNRFDFWQRFITGELYYEASSQKTARLEKVFIRVQQGTGNYIYLGDINLNGLSDEEEFEPTIYEGDYILTTVPTDELFPVIDLKTNTRWKIEFEKIFKSNSIFKKILTPVSTETNYRIEENSKVKNSKDIYFLNFSKFLDDSTTLKGFNLFQQDLNLFNNNNDFSLRFRFSERRNLNQYSGGLEKGYLNERSVRLKFRMGDEINNLTDYNIKNEIVSAPPNLNRSINVTASELSTEFSYRPFKDIEFGLRLIVGIITDKFPTKPTEIANNDQLLRFTYSLAGKGRIRIEIERDELTAGNTNNIIPFTITQGKVIGKNYLWRLNFDYRLTTNLQTTIAYNGRKQGSGDIIHTLRAEARAYF